MDSQSLRSFSLGLLFATSVLGTAYYMQLGDTDDKKSSHTLTDKEVQAYLKEKNYLAIKKEEYDAYRTDNEAKVKVNVQELHSEENITVIEVTDGMKGIEIIHILTQTGKIDNPQQFEQYLYSHNLEDKIQSGTYALMPGMTYEEIADRLTGKK